MTELLLFILFIILLIGIFVNLKKIESVYKFNLLSTSVMFGFVFIQLVGIYNSNEIPNEYINKTIIMTILCMVMVYIGTNIGNKKFNLFNWSYDNKKLLKVSVIYSIIGAIFYFLISRLPEQEKSNTQWSGIIVAFRFFSQLMNYGFIIGLFLFLNNKSKLALAIILFDITFYFDRIFVAFRKGEIALLICSIMITIWFRKKWIPPRFLIILLIFIGTLFLYSTGDYRDNATEKSTIDTITEVDFLKNFKNILLSGGEELTNAIYQIEAADKNLNLNYGASLWNDIIFNYIPAQLVGDSTKSSLMIDLSDPAFIEFGYIGLIGSTFTGIADAFLSFWYFGSIYFLIIAYLLNRVYLSALNGNVAMQLIYSLIIVNGLHVITHLVSWFINPIIHVMIFMIPALYFSRTKSGI